MFKSLRGQLMAFWVILLGAGVALGILMVVLFRSSAGVQIAVAKASAEQACSAIAARYGKSLADPAGTTPQLDLLQVLLQLVLVEAPHVEGGVWSAGGGLLAYAYPSYEGSGTKTDIPPAEQPHIVTIAGLAARSQALQTDVVRGNREALVVSACPLRAPQNDLAAWTMTRTPADTLDAQDSLRWGLAVLLLGLLASGAWLGVILVRTYRRLRGLEHTLASADAGVDARAEAMPALAATGLAELDRIVVAFNHYRGRYDEARVKLRSAAAGQARDQRLAALGRMTGSIAHEIRNPIAAMRLKAENALAASPDRHADALQLILGQIARLDGLVQSLLAVVQPVQLHPQPFDVAPWLAERAAAFAPQARARRVALAVDPPEVQRAVADPLHLARAVDNLVDNAVRHAPEGGRVRISAGRATGQSAGAPLWRIAVDDDGPGVSPELQSRLFEPFATGRADGTGLGLALAREVAIAHGGDLRHMPLAGGGTRFELELPWHDS